MEGPLVNAPLSTERRLKRLSTKRSGRTDQSKIRTLPPTLVLTMKLGGTFTAATPGCRVAWVATAIAEHG
jgi:hypothetical protein